MIRSHIIDGERFVHLADLLAVIRGRAHDYRGTDATNPHRHDPAALDVIADELRDRWLEAGAGVVGP